MPSYVLKRKEIVPAPFATQIGAPSIIKGVMSGFSTANCVAMGKDWPANAKSFELVFKVRTGSDVSTQQCIYNAKWCVWLYINSGKFVLSLGQASSWNITNLKTGTYSVLANTTYWIRLKFTGSSYLLDYSLDGATYSNDITVTSSASTGGGLALYLGIVNDKTYPFYGSIDFNESYLNVAGTRFWTGVMDRDVPNVGVVGSPLIFSSNLRSGYFGRKSYLTIPMTFQPGSGDTWELGFKVTTGTLDTQQNILGIVPNERGGVEVTVTSSKWALWLSTGTAVADYIAQGVTGSYTVLADTTYWIKIAYDGSTYTLSYSLDGETYVEDISVSSTAAIYANTQYCLGTNGYPESAGVWTGHIFLDGCYAKINGEVIWKGTKPSIYIENYVLKRRKIIPEEIQDWTQPIATANKTAIEGGYMVITSTSGDTGSTVNYAWYAMDNTFSGNRFWEVKAVTSWWQVKFPYKLKITGLKYYKGNNDSNNTTSVAFYTSSDMTTQIGTTTSTGGSAWQGFAISGIPTEGIVTDTIYVRLLSSTGNYTSMGELQITAKKVIPEHVEDTNYVLRRK